MTFKFMTCIFAASVTLCALAQGRDPQWFQRRMSELDRTLLESDKVKKIESLGEFIGIGRYGYNSMDDEQRAIFGKAQSALLSIPGHAQYYQNKIEDSRKQVKANENLSPEEKERLRRAGKPAVGLGDYWDVRDAAFQVLAQLPSPETVAVLGHFLEDPEGRNGKDLLGNPLVWHDDVAPAYPNCWLACISITNLGIEHAPIGDVSKLNSVVMDPAQVDAWKGWWQEVKSGKRTYRFKGSAIEYGADDPATKEQLEKTTKDRKQAEKGRKGTGSESESPKAEQVAPPNP